MKSWKIEGKYLRDEDGYNVAVIHIADDEPAKVEKNNAEEADQAYREIEGDAEIVRLREMNASMLAGLERVAKWINESAGNFSDDPADDECPVFVRTLIRKAKGPAS